MNWKTTWLLLLLAAVLFTFIYFVEQHTRPTSVVGEPPPRLVGFQPAEVSAVQIRRTNQFLLRAERTNSEWTLVAPISYPAQSVAIEQLLHSLLEATAHTYIPMQELSHRGQSIADFGLDVPIVTLTVLHQNRRTELLFGAKTPVGDNVYVQLLSQPGIFVLSADLFDRLPQTVTDWRDPRLLNLTGLNVDRLEVRSRALSYEIRTDPTNKVFWLSKPTSARADTPKVFHLLRTVQTAKVSGFVTDDPRTELDPYGLQPPELELVFGDGSNDLVTVQFGKSPTNDPNTVYARRLAQTNIVLVARSVLDSVKVTPNDLRDHRLLSFSPVAVDAIEVVGPENFSVRRQKGGGWMVSGNTPYAGDEGLVRRWLEQLGTLEGVVEKDVVTDFGVYGLAPPLRQYILRGTVTNHVADVTNRILDQLDLGARESGRVFARRASENTVHAISRSHFDQLPSAAWQLRDRRVWTFATNQIKSVTISDLGKTRRILPGKAGDWVLAPGSSGIINPDAINETLYRLGQLQAEVWVERGAGKRALYGFSEQGYKMTLELDDKDKPQVLSLEFGGFAESKFPYAMASVDGQPWIFEFPLKLFFEIKRDLPASSSTP